MPVRVSRYWLTLYDERAVKSETRDMGYYQNPSDG
jgi:hypothetical protein